MVIVSFLCVIKKLAEPTCYLQHRFVYEGVKGAIPTGLKSTITTIVAKENTINQQLLKKTNKSIDSNL